MVKQWINFCLALLTAGSFYGHQALQNTLISTEPVPGPGALSGSYAIEINQYDWGCCVDRAILRLDSKVTVVRPEQFSVTEEKQAWENSSADMFATSGALTIIRTQRQVTAAYLCDSQGRKMATPSNYVALEMSASPDIGSPLCLHASQLQYRWAQPYQLVIDLAPGHTLSGSSGGKYTRLSISRTPTQRLLPTLADYDTGLYSSGGYHLPYASFSPREDGDSHPLVIWLHGLGEGGSDPLIPLLGSRAGDFAQEEFQTRMGGAYILVPQCPTMWLDDGSGAATATGQSCYTQPLLDLIRDFVDSHPGVDRRRIYVGGCSNGGYMTLSLLLQAPDYFAAAFPICQAYQDSWLTQEDIQTLKDIPIWFTHSALDQVCPPQLSTFPTVTRLLEAGGANLHLNELGEITSPDAPGYVFNPHYSWIYALGDGNMFQWLAQQHR